MDIISPNSGLILPDRAEEGAPVGVPDTSTLRTINARVARTPLGPEQVYVARMEMNSTRLDSWFTWFDYPSQKRFKAAVEAKGGRPMVRQHAREFPFGMLFEAQLEKLDPEDPFIAQQTDPSRKYPYARRFGAQEYRIVERFFVVRDRKVPTATPFETNDIIAGVDDGTIGIGSVGASIHPADTPNGDLVCDFCNQSMLDPTSECECLPGMLRETKKGLVIVTARYTNASQAHGSFVDAGATPGAHALYDRAVRLQRAKLLSPEDTERFSDLYRASIVPAPIHSIPTTVGAGAGKPAPADPDSRGGTMPNPVDRALEPVRSFLDTVEDELSSTLDAYSGDAWEAGARLLADRLREAHREQGDSDRRLDQLKSALAKELGGKPGDDVMALVRKNKDLAAVGEEARLGLLEEYKGAFVRVHGQHDDAEILQRAEPWTLKQLRQELVLLDKLTEKVVTAGTTADRAVNGRLDPDEPEVDDDEVRAKKPARVMADMSFVGA